MPWIRVIFLEALVVVVQQRYTTQRWEDVVAIVPRFNVRTELLISSCTTVRRMKR